MIQFTAESRDDNNNNVYQRTKEQLSVQKVAYTRTINLT
jgi:hypothetical protein